MKKLLNNKKGRFGIVELGLVFIELIVFVIFLPQINILIASLLPNLTDVMAQWLVKLIPLSIVMAISIGLFSKGDQ